MPAVGVRYPSRLVTGANLLERLQPVLGKATDGQKLLFSINKIDPYGIDLTTDDGFQYGFFANKAFVNFQHKLKWRHNSGANPSAEMISKPAPFTELLAESSYRLREAMVLIDPKAEGTIDRLGVVTTTVVSEDDAPPGILKLLRHIGQPWSGVEAPFDIAFSTLVGKSEKHRDVCLHHISKSDEKDALLTVRLDWQRNFTEHRSVRALEEMLNNALDSSLSYFEDVAEGARFDHHKPS